LFRARTPKETRDTGVVCLVLPDEWFAKTFFSQVFAFALVIGIIWKKKTYPAMDLPVYGESDDA